MSMQIAMILTAILVSMFWVTVGTTIGFVQQSRKEARTAALHRYVEQVLAGPRIEIPIGRHRRIPGQPGRRNSFRTWLPE
jgi:hypothetical protein